MRPLTILAIVAIIAVPVVTFYDFNGHSLDISDRQVVLVVTDSMDGDVHDYDIGSFPANTLVMVEHLSYQEKRFLRIGDVISYYDGDMLIHHRIVKVEGDTFYVHGDNNHSTDKVNIDDINGVVVGTNVWIGHATSFVQHNFLVFLGIMFVLCSALIVYAVYSGEPKKEVESE